jgi:hypothetical protein
MLDEPRKITTTFLSKDWRYFYNPYRVCSQTDGPGVGEKCSQCQKYTEFGYWLHTQEVHCVNCNVDFLLFKRAPYCKKCLLEAASIDSSHIKMHQVTLLTDQEYLVIQITPERQHQPGDRYFLLGTEVFPVKEPLFDNKAITTERSS